MDRNTAKEEIKNREPAFLQKAPQRINGHTSYVCPACGNGSGSTGSGIALDPHSKTKRYKCFVCGLSEDVIGLWKISKSTQDDAEAFKGLYEYYGISVENQNQYKTEQYTHTHNSIHTSAYTQEDKMDYINTCAGRATQTEYFKRRGLSDETVRKYRLGFDPSYKAGRSFWRAVIIPTGTSSYVARNTDETAGKDDRYRKTGKSQIYLKKTLQTATEPIFITEGELDALSIIEAGGVAVGLGSTANASHLIAMVKETTPAQPLVLALDNDEDGQKTASKMAEELTAMEIPFYRFNPYGEAKDANGALMASREDLRKKIREAVDMAQEAVEVAKKEAEKAKEAEKEAYRKTSVGEGLQDFLNAIKNGEDSEFTPTGFHKLDSVLEGGLYDGLYTVGAISSLGKTTLVLQIADQIAEAGNDVLIFSLEMPKRKLMARSISRHTLIDVLENHGDVKNAKTSRGILTGSRYAHYNKAELELIERSTKSYASYAGNIYIREGVGDIGVQQIREGIEEHISLTGKKPVVFIDYIQIIAPADPRATDKQNTDKAVLELVRMGRDYKIPVVAISSVNRAGYNSPIAMESLKETGNLEFDSDVILGLQFKGVGDSKFNVNEAKKKNPREIELVVLKNRDGETGGKLSFQYYPMFNYFREV